VFPIVFRNKKQQKFSFVFPFFLQIKSNISIETNLDNVAAFIDTKISQHKDEILHVLYECAAKLPEKLMLYSTLAGLVNVKNYNFVGEVGFGIFPGCIQLYFCSFFNFFSYMKVCWALGKKSQGITEERKFFVCTSFGNYD
jgi:hypothetical protein